MLKTELHCAEPLTFYCNIKWRITFHCLHIHQLQDHSGKLKADRPWYKTIHLGPPITKNTDKYPRLVMVTVCPNCEGNCLLLHSASWAPNIGRVLTDGWTDGWTLPNLLSPCFAKASWSMKTFYYQSFYFWYQSFHEVKIISVRHNLFTSP